MINLTIAFIIIKLQMDLKLLSTEDNTTTKSSTESGSILIIGTSNLTAPDGNIFIGSPTVSGGNFIESSNIALEPIHNHPVDYSNNWRIAGRCIECFFTIIESLNNTVVQKSLSEYLDKDTISIIRQYYGKIGI